MADMEGDLTHQQMQNVLKLCDILAIEDFTVAALMLKQCDWNLERALGLDDNHHVYQPQPKIIPPKPIAQPIPQAQPPQQTIPQVPQIINNPPLQLNPTVQTYQNNQENLEYYNDIDEEQANNYQYDYQYYQQQFQKQKDIQRKRRNFNQDFASIPLIKTKSQVMDNKQHELFFNKQVSENYSYHRFQYQANLLQNSANLCERILNSKSSQIRKCYDSIQKNENNRKFLSYLYKKYETKINFTFGTFLLNLTRGYLDGKQLLVYIHKSEFEQNKSVKMILCQSQIANFINKFCISYGMFDNSDDYQILNQYVPMKNLPAFVLFKFNKKQMKQQFIDSYSVLQSNPQNFLQWLASRIGVGLKKKQPQKQKKQQKTQNDPTTVFAARNKQIYEENERKRLQLANIMYEQNLEYEQMARLYQMKREKSKARKMSIQAMEEQIQRLKQKFKEQPAFQSGKTIQVRFRLPMSGNSLLRVFKLTDKVSEMFEYIHCFGRDQFEQRLSEFDLTQTFPKLNLIDKKQTPIFDIFPDSQRQNIIVKQLQGSA